MPEVPQAAARKQMLVRNQELGWVLVHNQVQGRVQHSPAEAAGTAVEGSRVPVAAEDNSQFVLVHERGRGVREGGVHDSWVGFRWALRRGDLPLKHLRFPAGHDPLYMPREQTQPRFG